MAEQEIEYIAYPKLKHIKMFVDEVKYRNQHLHPEIELCFLLKGEAIFKTGKRELLLKKKDVLLLNGNEAHSIEGQNGSCVGLFLQISNHFLREYVPTLRNEMFETNLLSDYLSQKDLQEIFSLGVSCGIQYLEEKDFYQYDVIADLAVIFKRLLQNVPHQSISEKERERSKKNNARIARVISYIDEHLQEKIKLEDIALKEEITSTHLSHLFSESFGMGFQDYINAKRFEEALRLMAEGEKTMLEISIEAGFSDQKYMTKMFKDRFGTTPKAFVSKNLPYVEKSGKKNNPTILERIYSSQESIDLLHHYLAEEQI